MMGHVCDTTLIIENKIMLCLLRGCPPPFSCPHTALLFVSSFQVLCKCNAAPLPRMMMMMMMRNECNAMLRMNDTDHAYRKIPVDVPPPPFPHDSGTNYIKAAKPNAPTNTAMPSLPNPLDMTASPVCKPGEVPVLVLDAPALPAGVGAPFPPACTTVTAVRVL